MSEIAESNPELIALKKLRESKEIEKLHLEVSELKRPLWQRPTNLLGVITALVAVGGLIVQSQFTQHTIRGIQQEANASLVKAQVETATVEANLSNETNQANELKQISETLRMEIEDLNQQKARSIAEAEVARARLEEIEAQLAEAEASGEPLPADTIGTIRQSIGQTYKGFECGQGTQFHCP